MGAMLIALMGLGSVLMWLGLPVAVIWGVSLLQANTRPSMGPYLLIVVALAVEIAVLGKLLAILDRRYMRLHGIEARRERRSWNRSLSGERTSGHRETVLDIVMIISVAVATLLMAIWFFAFAGSSLPGS
jgi:hypothetical protein